MSDAVLILSTAASPEEASRIADALVADGLAACVQMAAVQSCYRWQGAIEHAQEIRLEIKTTADRAEAAAARLRALHSYDVPEILIVPILGGSADYLAWIAASVEQT
ncbi:divalent-cation tolerance protein CutA [uncultured Sphingomonas sp.]|uniref:divalent-cation tolerance protein CutA n=1 Tax=uncultured Sphingomonas sp. TaxID=158754 RepID=UPI0025FA23F0|nr:divalent-cation tolerance protein CutA [uncultured Sphingomonas sp.]